VQLAHYLGLLHRSQETLGQAFREVGEAHRDEHDVFHQCRRLARRCDRHAESLAPFAEHYGEDAPAEPDRLHATLFEGTREGPLGLLRDLHDLYLMATECELTWTLVAQAAQGARDADLLAAAERGQGEAAGQLSWLLTRMKQAAPQALVVAD
jgi:hypothetical protein